MGHSRPGALDRADREALASRGWLSAQPPALREAVLDACVTRRVAKGETVFDEGSEPGGLYGLAEGWLDVVLAPGGAPPSLVHVASRGWWFGDAALLTRTPRRGTHVARTDCRMAYLPPSTVVALEAAGFDPYRAIAHITVGVVDHSFAVHAAFRIRSPLQRTARMLQILLGSGLHYAAGAALDPPAIPISQEEFAEIANLSRNAAGDALRTLSEAGALHLGFRAIELLDPGILERHRG
ncbi:Crp/Fnr family transcriptional regulator [Albimonas pacifica]|uniref:cAMP-binding domain of CRP or a regulatory subunit of cAMP-dependent protein kinases n=1 Tax=Albimonas pacifica TaxID=1114924 RepID=A0A1I3DFY0_9RHOB|nr:Crp/Fnr family transcriptional regulator [Albimonas pacifica]SFH85700.1 cAMP-binding domain of CRP or a regulatory subunit of cAMP-dependent protein kinases [Albimonas pacifica]